MDLHVAYLNGTWSRNGTGSRTGTGSRNGTGSYATYLLYLY